jgi:hypothetical protein
MGEAPLSKSCQLQILDVVDRLRNISNRTEAEFSKQAAQMNPLDMWAAEVRCLREQQTRLHRIATSLMGSLNILPDSPLGKAAQMAGEYGEAQKAEPDYHNKFHVAEVVMAAHLLGLREGLDKVQTAELLLAAIAHDFCHSGGNNSFDFEQELVSVEAAVPIFEKAGLDKTTISKISHMILATDFKVGVPPARQKYLDTRSLPEDNPERILASQALLLTEADVLFSCFDLDYNDLLSKLLAIEWKVPGTNLPMKARLGFLGYVKFISKASQDLGIDQRRLKLMDDLSKMPPEGTDSDKK